jgi:4-amino-4-deoxy-L-arabinose transferase-like glycosyltransferase
VWWSWLYIEQVVHFYSAGYRASRQPLKKASGMKKQLVEKQDFINIAILTAIALVIGVYLIATTVLIASDGISYIQYAKALASNPLEVIRDCSEYAPNTYTPGYPFLILLAHKVVGLFEKCSSVSSWIYSAQIVSLICRVLAIIPLYFIGGKLVGSKLSFWSLLILAFLPFPAKYGSDVLRDWPHMLFLATGLLLLFKAVQNEKPLIFGITGFIAGLGYTIREECAQLVVYGSIWLIFNIFRRSRKPEISRKKLACNMILLIAGFAIIACPYMKIREEILPARLQQIIEKFSGVHNSQNAESNGADYLAAIVPASIIKAFGKFVEKLCANLMYFFAPFLLIGIYQHFRKNALEPPIKFLMIAFIVPNLAMVILRYVCVSPALSGRYILPLTVITIFFVPIGLQRSAQWIDELFRTTICKNGSPENKSQQWFFILLIVGITICLPKLLRPLRIEKKDYRQAAEWIKENTQDDDLLAVSGLDPRVTFYADRKFIKVSQKTMPSNADFAVKMYDNDTEPDYRNGTFYGNGKDAFVDVSINPIPSSGDFTISGWVYCDGKIGNSDLYGTAFGSASWSGTAVKGIVIGCSRGDSLCVVVGDGSKYCKLEAVIDIKTVNKQKWYHIAAIYKSSKLEVYVNGELVGSSTIKYVDSGANFRVGHSNTLHCNEAHWYGRVKNVKIFKKALSASEIFGLCSKGWNTDDFPAEKTLATKKNRLILYQLPLILPEQ